MNHLYEAAREVQRFLKRKKWPYCLIGGLAVIRWGEYRATHDVDFTVLSGVSPEEREPFVDALLTQFSPRMEITKEFAMENGVFVCNASNGVGVDVALGGMPYERIMVARASPHQYAPRARFVTASAEDLIVMKAVAKRRHDWTDIEGILRRQLPSLDWHYVVKELDGVLMLNEDWEVMVQLETLKREVERDLAEIERRKKQ